MKCICIPHMHRVSIVELFYHVECTRNKVALIELAQVRHAFEPIEPCQCIPTRPKTMVAKCAVSRHAAHCRAVAPTLSISLRGPICWVFGASDALHYFCGVFLAALSLRLINFLILVSLFQQSLPKRSIHFDAHSEAALSQCAYSCTHFSWHHSIMSVWETETAR